MLSLYSNKKEAQMKAFKYLGPHAKLGKPTVKDKKYSVYDAINKKIINFGQIGYKDFTKTHDIDKRKAYLARSSKIKGDWKLNKYSPNNLSRNILW